MATIRLVCENFQDETVLNVYTIVEGDSINVYEVDDIDLELYDYSYHLDIDGGNDIVIVVLGDSIRIDTFTDFSHNRYGKCNNSIDVKYRHNGVLKESSELIFD